MSGVRFPGCWAARPAATRLDQILERERGIPQAREMSELMDEIDCLRDALEEAHKALLLGSHARQADRRRALVKVRMALRKEN